MSINLNINLNNQQKSAIYYLDGPLLVLAGAGSGKTGVITYKISYLLSELNIKPSNILALTFTNKAAREMKERVTKIVGSEKRRGLKVMTFHALGLRFLKKHYNLCGLRTGFSVIDQEDTKMLLKQILPDDRLQDSDFISNLLHAISFIKGGGLIQEIISNNEFLQEYLRYFNLYEKALKSFNSVDFDDLLRLPVEILQNNQEVLSNWQNNTKYLLVDEYQDTNVMQYKLIKLLVGKTANITVVGDDDQSIYAWRGAQPENLRMLSIDFPNLKVIKLEQNYRSTAIILNLANSLIANNKHLYEKALWTNSGHGEYAKVLVCQNENFEADQVISDLITHKLRLGTQYNQYAILYRNNYQSRLFEHLLKQHGIYYKLSGGQSWFSKTEIKDVLAYLRIMINNEDDAAFLRIINVPKRGIGNKTIEILQQYALQRQEPLFICCDHLALKSQLLDRSNANSNTWNILCKFKEIIQDFEHTCYGKNEANDGWFKLLENFFIEIGYEQYIYEVSDSTKQAEQKISNIKDLFSWINSLSSKNPEATLAEILQKMMLTEILEQEEVNQNHVKLMTLHAAKGLEFDYVYLVGMEEGLLPHQNSIDNDSLEEERRLAYVGITRAKLQITFSLTEKRKRAGEWVTTSPSRFLSELPKEQLKWIGVKQEISDDERKQYVNDHLQALKNLLNN